MIKRRSKRLSRWAPKAELTTTQVGARSFALAPEPVPSPITESWAAELVELLGRDSPDQPRFDVIIDGAGGDIFKKLTRHGLKKGAKVVCYGM